MENHYQTGEANALPTLPEGDTIYQYQDETGNVLYEKIRKPGKRFLQRLPCSQVYSLGDVRRVLYQLPRIVQADTSQTIYITEGEKDADRLRTCVISRLIRAEVGAA